MRVRIVVFVRMGSRHGLGRHGVLSKSGETVAALVRMEAMAGDVAVGMGKVVAGPLLDL